MPRSNSLQRSPSDRIRLKQAIAPLLLLLASGPAWSEWDPWGFCSEAPGATEAAIDEGVAPQELVMGTAYAVYRGFISPVNGSNCPMYPSCSRFARLAIREMGLGRGLLAVFDRLHRCGHDLRYYDLVLDGGRMLRYDPPSLNTGGGKS